MDKDQGISKVKKICLRVARSQRKKKKNRAYPYNVEILRWTTLDNVALSCG